MEEQLISFETAKLAKEKGFEETCYYSYDFDAFEFEEDKTIIPKLNFNYCEVKSHKYTPHYNLGQQIPKKEDYYYAIPSSGLRSLNKEERLGDLDDEGIITADAPTQSLLKDWLRKVYYLHVSVDRDYDGWCWKITEFSKGNKLVEGGSSEMPDYNIELEKGLQEALKLIKTKTNDKK